MAEAPGPWSGRRAAVPASAAGLLAGAGQAALDGLLQREIWSWPSMTPLRRRPDGTDPDLRRPPLQDEARELAVACAVWRGRSALVVCLVAAAAVVANDGAWRVWVAAAVLAVHGLPRRAARRLRTVGRVLGDVPPVRTVT